MNIKKIVMWVSVVCFALTAAIALYIYFSGAKFSGQIGRIMFTLMTIGVATSMSINGLNLYERKKNPLSLASLGLIAVSALLALYLCWFQFKWNNLAKFVILISVTSILFNFVVTCILNLKKEKLIFQIFVYVNLIIFDFYVGSLLYNFKAAGKYMGIMVVNIVFSIFGSIILTVFSRKNYGYIDPNAVNTAAAPVEDGEYIRISKAEYDALKERIAELENQLNNKQ